jgi:hypothetical protein
MAVNISLSARSSPCLILRIAFDSTLLGTVVELLEEKRLGGCKEKNKTES